MNLVIDVPLTLAVIYTLLAFATGVGAMGAAEAGDGKAALVCLGLVMLLGYTAYVFGSLAG